MNQHEYYKMLEEQMLTKESLQLGEAFCRMVKECCGKEINRALEVGCGYGVAATYIKDIVRSLTLTDIDELALDFNIKHWANEPHIKIVSGSNMNKIWSYDLIYYFLSLHHINDIASELREIKQRLSHNGSLFICELKPVKDSPFHIHEKSAHDGLWAESLCNIAVSCGYSVQKVKIIGTINKDYFNKTTSYDVYILWLR